MYVKIYIYNKTDLINYVVNTYGTYNKDTLNLFVSFRMVNICV